MLGTKLSYNYVFSCCFFAFLPMKQQLNTKESPKNHQRIGKQSPNQVQRRPEQRPMKQQLNTKESPEKHQRNSKQKTTNKGAASHRDS